MIHNYGVGIDYITVHIEIDSKMNIMSMHELTNKIEKDFKKVINSAININGVISDKKNVALSLK